MAGATRREVAATHSRRLNVVSARSRALAGWCERSGGCERGCGDRRGSLDTDMARGNTIALRAASLCVAPGHPGRGDSLGSSGACGKGGDESCAARAGLVLQRHDEVVDRVPRRRWRACDTERARDDAIAPRLTRLRVVSMPHRRGERECGCVWRGLARTKKRRGYSPRRPRLVCAPRVQPPPSLRACCTVPKRALQTTTATAGGGG